MYSTARTFKTQPWTVATQILERAPFDQIMEVLCTNTLPLNTPCDVPSRMPLYTSRL